MVHNSPIRTTLPREEAWMLDDMAQDLGVRRSHVTRGMLRYVMRTHAEEFVTWLREEDGEAIEAPIDPVPAGLSRET